MYEMYFLIRKVKKGCFRSAPSTVNGRALASDRRARVKPSRVAVTEVGEDESGGAGE